MNSVAGVGLDYHVNLFRLGAQADLKSKVGPPGPLSVVAVFLNEATSEAALSAAPIIRLFLEEIGVVFEPPVCPEEALPSEQVDAELQRVFAAQIMRTLSNRAMKKGMMRASEDSQFDVKQFITATIKRPERDDSAKQVQRNVSPRRPNDLRRSGLGRREATRQ